jgi:hypothetical protein
MTTQTCLNLPDARAAEGVALFVLRNLHRQAADNCAIDVVGQPIDILWDSKENTTTLVTTKMAKSFDIMLSPCIPNTMKLRTDSVHPEHVKITATGELSLGETDASNKKYEFYAHPEWEEPVRAHESAVAGARADR